MRWLAAAALAALVGCARGPQEEIPVSVFEEPPVDERVYFRSPGLLVEHLYRSLEEGDLSVFPEAFLQPGDVAHWERWAASPEGHPWPRAENHGYRIHALREQLDGSVVIEVIEWAGEREVERAFRCLRTDEGWRIAGSDGQPGNTAISEISE